MNKDLEFTGDAMAICVYASGGDLSNAEWWWLQENQPPMPVIIAQRNIRRAEHQLIKRNPELVPAYDAALQQQAIQFGYPVWYVSATGRKRALADIIRPISEGMLKQIREDSRVQEIIAEDDQTPYITVLNTLVGKFTPVRMVWSKLDETFKVVEVFRAYVQTNAAAANEIGKTLSEAHSLRFIPYEERQSHRARAETWGRGKC